MPTPEQMVSPSPNVQPQQPARPLQSPTIPNMPNSITIHKVASKAEKSNFVQSADNLSPVGENDEQLDQMETDETQFEDEEMVDETDDEEEADENEGTVNGNVEQNDLRDIFPELRDTETQ